MIGLKDLEEYAEREVARAKERIEQFAAELTSENRYSSHTLEWSIGYFEAAAKDVVFSKILTKKGKREESDEETVAAMAEYALAETINGARWPERSTSPISCTMKECVTAAWASLYCLITGRQ